MAIWVCKVIRIAAVYVCVDVGGCATCPGHGSSGAASRPGAAARRRIIPDVIQSLSNLRTRGRETFAHPPTSTNAQLLSE